MQKAVKRKSPPRQKKKSAGNFQPHSSNTERSPFQQTPTPKRRRFGEKIEGEALQLLAKITQGRQPHDGQSFMRTKRKKGGNSLKEEKFPDRRKYATNRLPAASWSEPS